jgi:hypothetical protein
MRPWKNRAEILIRKEKIRRHQKPISDPITQGIRRRSGY